MKKIVAVLLALLLLGGMMFAAVSCAKDGDGDEQDGEETTAQTNAVPAPGSTQYVVQEPLTLSSDAEYTDGKLVLHFNESIGYSGEEECFIGLVSELSAESIAAKPDMEASAGMQNDDRTYSGVVLIPGDEIIPGDYSVSVTVGDYIVERFDLTF